MVSRSREDLCRDRLNVDAAGFAKFVPALAYHFCLKLPAAFTQPGAPTLANLCNIRVCLLNVIKDFI